ncbi:MAG: ABC transporter permease [Peptoniphilaceae bacterium]|nr:ABC transporter permease [Peptoniphilaceae bacterium]MDD7383825.1 ABC transporter permease [Peptoniphilaceae bacterium]MDY3737598.1 ABC transporter permease [Peptoniphilaceae bacterium]
MKIVKFISSEIFRMIILIISISILSFFLITSAPIDPLTSYVGSENSLSQEAKNEISEYWGLNEKKQVRFFKWAKNALNGDLGVSITYKKSVSKVLIERFSNSFFLMFISWFLSAILGLVLGIKSAMNEGGIIDKFIRLMCFFTKSSPPFWIAILILMVFSVKLGLFPLGMATPLGKLQEDVTFLDRFYHLVLPSLSLILVSFGDIALFTREKYIEIINSDYILYAKSRGESKGEIVKRHVLRNILIPFITITFSSFGELFGGTALIESVFSYPGIGTATVSSALNADVPLLIAISIFSAIFVFCGNLTADILYLFVDPSIKKVF